MRIAVHVPTRNAHDFMIKHFASKGIAISPQHRWSYNEVHCLWPDYERKDLTYSDKKYAELNGTVIPFDVYLGVLGVNYSEIIEVKLNDEFSAKIDPAEKIVSVGCKSFKFSAIEELYKAIKKTES